MPERMSNIPNIQILFTPVLFLTTSQAASPVKTHRHMSGWQQALYLSGRQSERERERKGTENSFGHCTTLTKPSAKGHMTKPQGTYMGFSEHWLVTQNFPYSNCHLDSVTCPAHAPMPGIAFPPRIIAKWPSICGAEALEATAPCRIGTGSLNWQKSFAAPNAPIH